MDTRVSFFRCFARMRCCVRDTAMAVSLSSRQRRRRRDRLPHLGRPARPHSVSADDDAAGVRQGLQSRGDLTSRCREAHHTCRDETWARRRYTGYRPSTHRHRSQQISRRRGCREWNGSGRGHQQPTHYPACPVRFSNNGGRLRYLSTQLSGSLHRQCMEGPSQYVQPNRSDRGYPAVRFASSPVGGGSNCTV